jgi:hypothetical protein
LFPELNIKKIREIGKRWATQFQNQGGFFTQIILCRYSANRFYEYQAPKYAVVLDVRHYEKPDYIDGPRHLELFVSELVNSPYCSLARLTNYAAWAKNDPKGSRTQLKKHFPWNYLFFNEEDQRNEVDYQKKFIGQTGFETPSDFVSAGIPYYFEEDYFTDVYVDRAPDNWRHQWLFIPLFKGCELPNQIQVTDVAIIYPNDSTIELIDEDQTPETLARDPQLWKFQFTGAQWLITFEGQQPPYSIKNFKPVKYIIPLIKQPGKCFGHVELCQIVEGAEIKDELQKETIKKEAGDVSDESTVYEDGLIDHSPTNKHTEEERQRMKDALCQSHKQYLKNPDKHKDSWAEAKKFAETEYGILTDDSGGTLEFQNSNYPVKSDSDYEKASKTISTNKGRFLEHIKKTGCDSLYQHFRISLISEKGRIQYVPPEGSPLWEIIWKK